MDGEENFHGRNQDESYKLQPKKSWHQAATILEGLLAEGTMALIAFFMNDTVGDPVDSALSSLVEIGPYEITPISSTETPLPWTASSELMGGKIGVILLCLLVIAPDLRLVWLDVEGRGGIKSD